MKGTFFFVVTVCSSERFRRFGGTHQEQGLLLVLVSLSDKHGFTIRKTVLIERSVFPVR
jgi:hypothetical protein